MPPSSAISSLPAAGPRPWADRALRWSAIGLAAIVWTSSLLFGLYILAFYAAALARGEMATWNDVLPGLYDAERPIATWGVGLHFAFGGLILVLGGVQLLSAVRRRFPAAHRWIGRLYVAACAVTAIGGLAFIASKGTIGGTVMDIGFGLYGILMLVAAVETFRHARAGRYDRHRAWGIRLFALAIGSWLYRMDYGFWIVLTGGLGHASGFRGPFDQFMAFFFYLPNLVVAEAFIRARSPRVPSFVKWIASLALVVATGAIVAGTWYFTVHYWGPPIVALVRGGDR
ncbi:MAG: DUF2306 domain-containing protein [Phycisphaerae bacterium]|nr:DUF2306 domain-containing protein [Phycisphaerae bacterium]